MINRFPHYKQLDSKDCGPTCIKIVSQFYNRTISIQKIRDLCETTRSGSSLLNISDAAEKIGLRTLGVKINLLDLNEVSLPCILFWNQKHFVVLYKIKQHTYFISDPAHGLLSYSKNEFLKNWIGEGSTEKEESGVSLMLEPTPNFYSNKYLGGLDRTGFRFLWPYILKYKPFIYQLLIGLLASSMLQLIFPFLTQSIVDVGIKNQDINFIYLILFAQLMLFIGRTSIEVIRGWILLHLSTRINISLISDFFIKLMSLPISYFDTRMAGDILQRIHDHSRIERILTTSSLNVLFSMVSILIFGIVLAIYSIEILLVFLLGSLLYFLWIVIFLKKRRDIDYKRFSQLGREQSKVIELIRGMQTIKLHNAERNKRWGWEFLQVKLFKISMEGLALEQYQNVGSGFINEVKNIFITILSATLVIDGKITLGMLLAISYIVGQLNSPITQLINFIRELQDAKMSLERLAEIHNKENEEEISESKICDFKKFLDVRFKGMSFKYLGTEKLVLDNLSLIIPAKKITAIVGTSGSGKTTLFKMVLKYYEPNEGEITLGDYNLRNISQKAWRERCGVVMQEDYIFNDSIANNIAVGSNNVDKTRLINAVEIANIREFIEQLPQAYNTKIGSEGVGLSTGQTQRLLIARAVYKNPDYIFLDEATSALDANNEKIIMNNLNTFFLDRTVIIIAHRLSTVKNADQIIVLDNGKIVEIGNHLNLVKKRGNYYSLIKNQLELGN